MLRFYRRILPHWRLDAPGTTYFVTWHLQPQQPRLSFPERSLIAEILRHGDGDRFRLVAFVVMDDHVHVLVRLVSTTIDPLVHSWKSFSAHELRRWHSRTGHVWQRESFDRVIRDERELLQKAEYIHNNPWKRWPEIPEYEWVWPGAV